MKLDKLYKLYDKDASRGFVAQIGQISELFNHWRNCEALENQVFSNTRLVLTFIQILISELKQ